MRKIYLLLIVSLLISPVLMAQKKVVTKKDPNIPVLINTTSGKNIPVPAMKPAPRNTDVKKVTPRAKVTMRNKKASKDDNFTKVTRRMPLKTKGNNIQRGGTTLKDFDTYYPKKNNVIKEPSTLGTKFIYGSITLSNQGMVDNFNSTYPNCDEVGTLIIDGPDVANLATLNNVFGIGVLIVKNTALTNLNGLQSLTNIYDSVVLENNSSLTSLGLNNVSKLGGLHIRDCAALGTVDAFNPSLTTIKNDVTIKNAGITSLAGLSNITSIGGDLAIQNLPIESLAELNNLTTVHYLEFENNSQLSELGLTNITSMWGFIFIDLPLLTNLDNFTQNLGGGIGTFMLGNMGSLTDISGLTNLSSLANFYIWNCPELTDLHGLENMYDARYGMSLTDNSSLTDISALSGITSVDEGILEISWNNSLSSLNGLENILQVDALWIIGNNELRNLNDLNSYLEIFNVEGADLKIYYNYQLSICSVPAICNYLNSTNAVNPEIHDNAGSCGSLASVMASCGGGANCTTLEDITWTGNNSGDWNDPLNWTPNKVPDECSKVIISTTNNDYPGIENDVSIGGLRMSSSTLYVNGYKLTIGDSVYIRESEISGYGHIILNSSTNPNISYSNFEVVELNILNYNGGSYFYGNSVQGNVRISDKPSRNSMSLTYGNDIFGNLTFTNNSPNNENYLANASIPDEIYGDLIITNNNNASQLFVGIGQGEPLNAYGNVTLNGNNSNSINLSKISFGGSFIQSFNVNIPGNDVFTIEEMYFRKVYGMSLPLKKDLKISGKLLLGTGDGTIKMDATKTLIIGDTCIVVDMDPINGNMVDGKMRKIGNTAFTFPIGLIKPYNNITKPADEGKPNSPQGVSSNYYKTPLSISAPSEVNASFVAEYKFRNPINDGYDTTAHDPGIGDIQTQEYWILTRESGTSNVVVTLNYSKSNMNNPFVPAALQIVGWNGSKWLNYGNGGTTGTNNAGTIKSDGPISTYGPLALAIKPIRKPIVTITPFDSLACLSAQFKVHFTLDTNAIQGNIFRVQLSDKNGSFTTGTQILNSKTTFQSDSILVTVPYNLVVGSQYRIRIIGTEQEVISENSLLLVPQSKPTTAFTIEGMNEVCVGGEVFKYYPSVKEEGVTYNWTVTRGTFTVDNDTAFVTFTSAGTAIVKAIPSNKCGNGTVVSRNITVKPAAPTAAPILTNVGRWLSASAPAAGQTVTDYKWYRNGIIISDAHDLAYYASAAGDYTIVFANDCGSSPISNSIAFAKASIPQTITFDNIPNKVYGDEPFNLPVSTSSGLPLSYQLVSGPGNITSGVYTITYSGTVVIKAYQLGDNEYDTAAPVTKSFVISKATQTITFDSIPDYTFSGKSSTIYVNSAASSGLNVSYTSSSGNIALYKTRVTINALGNVSIIASQKGDTNYLPAAPVTRTFCVLVKDLKPITGAQYQCPGNVSVYRTNKIEGLTYSWRLSNGTTFPSNSDTVKITWPGTGTYTLIVSAIGPCGPATPNDSIIVNVLEASIPPTTVTNMLPANGSIDQRLPLSLSWFPGNHTLSYDIYVWEDGTTQPSTPFASNISNINYTMPKEALMYNKSYKWQVISKNACLQAVSSIQKFSLRKLADLAVSDVQVPPTANSGQTITVKWKVKNVGGGITTTNESWNDAVFLSFDSIPTFSIPIISGSRTWNSFDFPVRPLLIGTKNNVAALGIGEEYTSSMDVTLPRNLDQPIYVYVINNYKGGPSSPLDANHANDTARAINPIAVALTPTPDLRVDTLLAPATTFSGSTINVTYKVTNYGVLTPSGEKWNDKIYISKSPLFNRKQSTVLKAPLDNGMYYGRNYNELEVENDQQLANDQSITKNVEVVIPNFISGTWFIHVVANEGQVMYEGALANNNDNNRAIQIILTPTPQFKVNSVNIPATQMSPAQPGGINWNVSNKGLYDNIERSKGKYYYVDLNSYCTPGLKMQVDSLSWGSSFWVENVYLSTDPSGLNISTAYYLGQVNQGIINSGWDMSIGLPRLSRVCSVIPSSSVNINNVIRPGSNHPNSFDFKIPADLPEGDYYFYVHTNPSKTVFTYPDTPFVGRSQKVTISWSDLTVPVIKVPTAITGGSTFILEYTIENIGAGSLYDANLMNKIYMSNSPVFDATATLIETVYTKQSISSGESVIQTASLKLPYGASGTKYFFVEVNAGKSFKEKSFSNNISSATSSNVTSAPASDLEITSVSIPGIVEATSVKNVSLYYTIKNSSAVSAIGETIDNIYISCNAVFDVTTALLLTTNKRTRSLNAGASVTDSVNISLNHPLYYLNPCFTKADLSSAYFFVKTNENGGIYEGGNTANNMGRSDEKMVVNRNVDLVVSSISGADNALVGRPYKLDYVIKNINANSPNSSHLWIDSVYFSKDSILNPNAIGISRNFVNGPTIVPLVPKSLSVSPLLPKIEAGDYYIFVRTNATNIIYNEVNLGNNSNLVRDQFGKAKKVHVVQPPLSDLVSEMVSAPTTVAVGQPFTYTYRVTNTGTGVTYPDKWNDEVWLTLGISQAPWSGYGDIKLSSNIHSGNLEAGNSYDVTVTVTIPLNTKEGNYLLSIYPDKGNDVVENIDSNNVSWKPITIYVPNPSDLIVESVSAPDTVYLGYAIDSVKWVVKNNSVNTAKGVSTDGIYLSKSLVFDSSAVLIGVKNKEIDLNPLASQTLTLSPVINNVPEGNYNVIVRTDLLNNIFESDKKNNENHTLKSVYVSVKELHLGITQADVLKDGRYYKLVIPDSLKGSTILVTLKSNDSLSVRNEMYVGKGYVPSVTTFDYKFNTPNYGNQQILIADVTAGIFYISVRCVSPNPQPQNITLNAVKLPFSILNVQSNKGGNGGSVTVKLTGSLFADSMTAKLNNGGTIINATKVYFVNSTLAFATFPLQGKPIGIYDVELRKTDGSETNLKDGFSVVSPNNGGLYSGGGVNTGPTGPGTQPGCDPGTPAGLNSQLVVEMVIPNYVFPGWPFIIQINYSNPTNMDIPVQTKILYNDKGIPMTLTKGDEKNGNKSSLYIELSETDGPPGVIRAGSSGSISVYTVTPPNSPNSFVHFNLK